MNFTITVSHRVARIELNAPPLNILTAALQDSLCREISALNARDDFNVLVLSSRLGVFSAGADVAEHRRKEQVTAMLKAAHGLIENLLGCPVPTLCAINGLCLGGAFELALGCDALIARQSAQLGWPEISLACFPPAALILSAWKLPPLLVSEMIAQGQTYPASVLAARGAGFLAVPDPEFDLQVEAACVRYASLARGALVETTRLLRPGAAQRFRAQICSLESAYIERILPMRDSAEGVDAFLNKRSPAFDHRGV